MSTVRDLITDSLVEIDKCAAGEDPTAEDSALGLRRLNLLLSSWSGLRSMARAIAPVRYTFVASKGSYTIGASGADFTATPPAYIRRANVVQTSQSPETRLSLGEPMKDEDFAALSVQNYSSSSPFAFWYDRKVPLGTVYILGYPTVSDDLELFVPQTFGAFSSYSTELELPSGYELALMLSLAQDLCGPFGKQVSNDLREKARKARSDAAALNHRSPRMASRDLGVPGGSVVGSNFDFNSRTWR